MAAPYTYDEVVNALEIQKANLPTYQTELGVTAAQLSEIDKQLDNLKNTRDYCELIDAAKKTAFGIKGALFNGTPGSPVSDYAPISTGSMPDPSQGNGMLDLFLARNRLWRAAPGYTHEIGVACALVRSSEAPDASTVKPTVECDPAQSGNLFTCIVKNRGESDLYDVLGCPVGDTQFSILKTTNTRSTDVTVPPKDPPGPQQFQVRIQLKRNGGNYGQMSDIVLVTVNP